MIVLIGFFSSRTDLQKASPSKETEGDVWRWSRGLLCNEVPKVDPKVPLCSAILMFEASDIFENCILFFSRAKPSQNIMFLDIYTIIL